MIDLKILSDAYQVIGKLDKVPFEVAAACGDTMADAYKRVPPIVADCVCKVYNVKKSEVIPSKRSTHAPIGQMSTRGLTVASLRFVYKGRLLTPVHFGMRPQSASMNPPRRYTLTMKVFRSKPKKRIGQHLAKHKPGGQYSKKSGNILFPTGGSAADGKYTHIPIQRMKPGHRPTGKDAYEKFTTVSMPQMILNEEFGVKDEIEQRVSDLSSKRLSHNLERHLFSS